MRPNSAAFLPDAVPHPWREALAAQRSGAGAPVTHLPTPSPTPGSTSGIRTPVARDPRALVIGGLEPCSACDWPGKLTATVFLQGCPLRCTYCHNPQLLDPRAPGTVTWAAVEELLLRRRGLLDAVVFSGGEPLRQDLTAAVARCRELGYGVGLHTSGAYPGRLASLLPLLDWVGLDVKTVPGDYGRLTGVPAAGEAMARSLDLLLACGVDHQLRVTWGTGHLEPDAVAALEAWLASRGAVGLVHQPIREAAPPPLH